jgi:hypothetical protein
MRFVRADDFLDISESTDPLGVPTVHVRTDLFEQLRRGPVADTPDLTAAAALTDLVHRELEAFGTGGGQRLQDEELELALKAWRQVLKRLGIDAPDLPFRNFATFYGYWKHNDLSGSWQARRDCLATFFNPLYPKFDAMEERELESQLANAVSPRGRLDWPTVDAELDQLRRRFASASTPQDYSAVGTACVRVLEALGEVVYDPAKHLRTGEQVPARDKTNMRIGRYVEDALPGADNAEIRKLANAASALAHQVKHRRTPDRVAAGIAADTVILLANILRRLSSGGKAT